jgi:hypothetical protein
MSTTITTDRVAIKAAIETSGADFAKVVTEIGDAGWKKKSGIPAWTCGQLAWHVASAFAFNADQIKNANTSGKALNPPALLRPTLYKLSELRVRLLSRKATPASVLTDLNAGIATLLATLASVDDDGLSKSATMMGDTRTIAAMFQVPVDHVAEHTAHIRAGLAAA